MKNKWIRTKWVINNKGENIVGKARFIIAILLVTISYNSHAQGTIDFDSGYGQGGLGGGWVTMYSSYTEKGFVFYSEKTPGMVGDGGFPYLGIATIDDSTYSNPTAFLWYPSAYPYSYVAFNQTSGTAFGLLSVQLASMPGWNDNYAITFVGTKTDSSIVSQIFNLTPGGDFLTYDFDSDFASGLVSVGISSPYQLFMDNLTYIPEPSTTALFAISLFAGWKTLRKRRCNQ